MRKTWVINLIGGPGVGKTTSAALLFGQLKVEFPGIVTEYVQEYAKKLVWIKDYEALNMQYSVTLKQYKLLKQINGQVDFIITDGPLIQGLFYNKYNNENTSDVSKTEALVLKTFNEFNNINIFLTRGDFEYEEEGRTQTESEAIKVDDILKEMLVNANINFKIFKSDPNNIPEMIQYIFQIVGEN